MGKNTYFFLASFLEMAELFWLELSREVQPETAIWHGKLQSKQLQFGTIMNGLNQGFIIGSIR